MRNYATLKKLSVFCSIVLPLAIPLQSNASILLAGWEDWNQTTTAATSGIGGLTAEAQTGGNADAVWRVHVEAASNDGTFGSFAGASTATGSSSGIYIRAEEGTGGVTGWIDFTITADVAQLTLEGFHFDSLRKRGNSPNSWALSVISGDITNGLIDSGGYSTSALGGPGPSNHEDFDFDLTTLADNVLEIGESATFRIEFSGGNAFNNDQKTYLDNVAITGVPEPSTALLVGLGMLVFLRRRR